MAGLRANVTAGRIVIVIWFRYRLKPGRFGLNQRGSESQAIYTPKVATPELALGEGACTHLREDGRGGVWFEGLETLACQLARV